MKRGEDEFRKFDNTMRQLMSVSHDELKAEIDREKAEKLGKKRKTKKSSASGREADKTD